MMKKLTSRNVEVKNLNASDPSNKIDLYDVVNLVGLVKNGQTLLCSLLCLSIVKCCTLGRLVL